MLNYKVTDVSVSTANTYAVIVTVTPPPCEILAFGPGAFIGGTNILWHLPVGTDLTSLMPTVTISPLATVSPANSATLSFTAPVTYTVTAEDGVTAKHYVVRAIADELIVNGGFETGDFTGWSAPGSVVQSATVHSGTYAALSGDDSGSGSTGWHNLNSDVINNLPANATLSVWVYRHGGGLMNLRVRSATGGDVINPWPMPRAAYNDTDWVNYIVALSPYAGTNLWLNVEVYDSDGHTYMLVDDVSLYPGPAITLSPSTLPNGMPTVAYSQTITASGGTAPYIFSASGTLPTGLTLKTNGVLSGIPALSGTNTFTVQAVDAYGYAGVSAYQLVIQTPTVTLSSATLPNGAPGVAYSQTINASGGVAPYTITLSSGTLPAGLTLTNGLLSGTPTTEATYNFTVQAQDANGFTGSNAYMVQILSSGCPTIVLSPTWLPDGIPTVAYSRTITASGGAAPYTNTVIAGTLPPGLALTQAGLLSGTPTTAGLYNFSVRAKDANGCAGTNAYALQIEAPQPGVGELLNGGFETGDFT